MKVDTQALEMHFSHINPGEWAAHISLIQAYHTARLADAMERVASHLENSQISTLEGRDIVNVLDRIARNTNQG